MSDTSRPICRNRQGCNSKSCLRALCALRFLRQTISQLRCLSGCIFASRTQRWEAILPKCNHGEIFERPLIVGSFLFSYSRSLLLNLFKLSLAACSPPTHQVTSLMDLSTSKESFTSTQFTSVDFFQFSQILKLPIVGLAFQLEENLSNSSLRLCLSST